MYGGASTVLSYHWYIVLLYGFSHLLALIHYLAGAISRVVMTCKQLVAFAISISPLDQVYIYILLIYCIILKDCNYSNIIIALCLVFSHSSVCR